MRTHLKEAIVTTGTFAVLALTVSTGIVFKLVGVPDVEILGYPFQYFWFVVGAWVTLFAVFGLYHRYVGRLEAEKEALRAECGDSGERGRSTEGAVGAAEPLEEE